jgi:hypothetical protein
MPTREADQVASGDEMAAPSELADAASSHQPQIAACAEPARRFPQKTENGTEPLPEDEPEMIAAKADRFVARPMRRDR